MRPIRRVRRSTGTFALAESGLVGVRGMGWIGSSWLAKAPRLLYTVCVDAEGSGLVDWGTMC